MQKSIVLNIFIAFLAGDLVAGCLAVPLQLLYVLAVMAVSPIIWYVCHEEAVAAKIHLWLLLLFVFITGMLRAVIVASNTQGQISEYIGQTVVLSETVAAVPIIKKIDKTNSLIKYTFQTEYIIADKGYTKQTNGKVIATVRQSFQEPVASQGQKLTIEGRLKSLLNYKNPGAIDIAAAMKRQWIFARLSVKHKAIKNISDKPPISTMQQIAQWRSSLRQSMTKAIPDTAAELNALIFGGYEGIRSEVIKKFTNAGLIHILAVSVSHLALIAGIFIWLGKSLRMRERNNFIIAVFAIVGYALLTGISPPVLRSLIMGILGLLAICLGRDKDTITAFALTGLIMLIHQPGLIYDISFQLTFSSTAGLIFFYPCLEKISFCPGWLKMPIAITLAAQLGVLSFIAWYFNSVSLIAIVTNLLIMPLIEAVIVIGLAGVAIVIIFSTFGKAIFWCCGLIIQNINLFVELLASIPASSIYIPARNFSAV